MLAAVLGHEPSAIERLLEGLESQAFRFRLGGDALVLRVNPSLRGFEKDRWADANVGRRAPVPRVVALGRVHQGLAYCVSEWLPGTTLEHLPDAEVVPVVDAVRRVWSAIGETDASAIGGYGDFGADARAPAATWREVLHATLRHGDDLAAVPQAAPLLETYGELIDRCPEEHGLIHGDFGSNNMLVHDGHVTGVVDWENAMAGDPLYDVANTYFWARHLSCMQLQAEHFERTLRDLPAYRERIDCYALRIGLEEVHEGLLAGNMPLAEWALGRCVELVGARR